jgi:serine/threonine-protein kinase RsbW
LAEAVVLRFPSSVRFVETAHALAEKLGAQAGFSDDEALNLAIAVHEGVINALVHGNRQDPKVPVEVRFDLLKRGIRVRIRDRGEGFDPQATPDPTDKEHILNTSGRGILMMRAYTDRLEFRRRPGRGMEVTMHKKVQSGRRGNAKRR